MLKATGINVNILNNKGETPLDIAEKRYNESENGAQKGYRNKICSLLKDARAVQASDLIKSETGADLTDSTNAFEDLSKWQNNIHYENKDETEVLGSC